MNEIDTRLAELGITIPTAPSPVAAYVPWTLHAEILHVSGQGTRVNGIAQYVGQLGAGLSLADGQAAARLCGLNLLAQVRNACGGNLSCVRRVLRLTGFVNSTPAFTEHPAVMNGCSELMLAVFGEAGRHARSAIGVASLPFGMATEVEGVFVIKASS